MTVDVIVPVLPESVQDATLLEWRKQAGDAVEKDEILIELETDKVVLEVPAPSAGVLSEVLKQSGDLATSQEVLARIDPTAAAAVAPAAASEAAAAPAAEPPASPAARNIMDQHGISRGQVSGSGADGRIGKADAVAAASAAPAPAQPSPAPASSAPPAPAPVQAAPSAAIEVGMRNERRVPMTRLRSRIAERLVEAQQTAAILTTFNEVDMQPVMDMRRRLRDDFEKQHGVRLGFMSFFAKAAVSALYKFPAINAYIEDNDIVYHDYCDIGVAVGSPRGLVVPILRNVEHLSFAGIEQKIGEFGAKAADGTLSIEDMTGGTFTISNGGVFGSLLSTPILNPPQSAILGMHKTQERPMVVDGEIVVRPMMYLALSYDHRIVDGREAVQFLIAIKEALEDPSRLLLEL